MMDGSVAARAAGGDSRRGSASGPGGGSARFESVSLTGGIALGIGGGLLLGLVMGHRIGHYGRGRSARVSMRHAAARREEGAARRGEGAARRGEGAPRRSDAAAPASTSETFMSA